MDNSKYKEFPAFFHSREPLNSDVEVIKFKEKIYWHLSIDKSQCEINLGSPKIQTLQPYEDNDDGLIDCTEIEDNYEIVQTKSGKYMTSFYVPRALQAAIIGPKGVQLKVIQERTNTYIKVPKPYETGNVKVTGTSERNVAAARNQITIIVLNKREKLPVSHFISIPVLSEEVKRNFQNMKEEILGGPPIRGIDRTIFQNPDKLHLTITTLTLLDDSEVAEAIKVLQSCEKDVISQFFPKGIKRYLTICGVEIMNDDPTDVNVLFGKVRMDSTKESEDLQFVCNEISNYFYKKGLIKKQYDFVKLHVTLMNSLFRKDERKKRESFDATIILNKYTNYNFGKVPFQTMYLSIRHTSNSDGYYDSVISINLI